MGGAGCWIPKRLRAVIRALRHATALLLLCSEGADGRRSLPPCWLLLWSLLRSLLWQSLCSWITITPFSPQDPGAPCDNPAENIQQAANSHASQLLAAAGSFFFFFAWSPRPAEARALPGGPAGSRLALDSLAADCCQAAGSYAPTAGRRAGRGLPSGCRQPTDPNERAMLMAPGDLWGISNTRQSLEKSCCCVTLLWS